MGLPHTKIALVIVVAALGAIAVAMVPWRWKFTAFLITLAAAAGVAWFAEFFLDLINNWQQQQH